MIYFISYDIEAGESRAYADVSLAIEACGAARRFQKSVWLLSTTKTAVEIRNLMKPFLSGNDTLFVGRLNTDDWAGWRTKLQAWIHDQYSA